MTDLWYKSIGKGHLKYIKKKLHKAIESQPSHATYTGPKFYM